MGIGSFMVNKWHFFSDCHAMRSEDMWKELQINIVIRLQTNCVNMLKEFKNIIITDSIFYNWVSVRKNSLLKYQWHSSICNRSWRTDLPKGACVIVETSVEHPDGPVMLGGVRGIVLASRYLIEPCGSGKSRIMHLSRVDTK